jgi:hypothetical protein
MGIIGSYVMWTLPLKEEEHQAESMPHAPSITGNPHRSRIHFEGLPTMHPGGRNMTVA